MVVLGQGGCIRAKVIVFGKSGCIRKKKNFCNRAKVVVFGLSSCVRKSGFTRSKAIVIGPKWLYSSKSGCIRVNVVVLG